MRGRPKISLTTPSSNAGTGRAITTATLRSTSPSLAETARYVSSVPWLGRRGGGQAMEVSDAPRPALAAAFGVVYVVWGSTYVGLKIGDEHWPPLGLSSVRFLVAGALLYGWCAWRRR